MAERVIRTLSDVLKKLFPKQKEDWDCYLSTAAFVVRTIKHSTTKQSQFYLLNGYEVSTPFEYMMELPDWNDT